MSWNPEEMMIKLSEERAKVRRIVTIAEKHGWNGVDNSKILAVFLDDTLTEAEKLSELYEKLLNVAVGLRNSLARFAEEGNWFYSESKQAWCYRGEDADFTPPHILAMRAIDSSPGLPG